MSLDNNNKQKSFESRVQVPEEHENSGWHQEDLVAGDELQDVLLVGCKFVQESNNSCRIRRRKVMENNRMTWDTSVNR